MSSRLPSVIDDRQESSVSYENSISNTNDMPLEVDSELIHKSVINMRFPVYIESMTGITFRVDVFPSDTINQIKQQLENTEGIPVSQQHLIWHYKELIDDKTIDDCGIGFGAQMRLVIGLITGPVFRSPDIYDKRDDIKDDIYESKPFLNTLLLLQNLDQIKLISIASEDNMSGNESEVKTRTNESGDQLSETLDFEKLNLREKEDIEMKQKRERQCRHSFAKDFQYIEVERKLIA
ncbi:unnamed protein product [Oppiella nova]|uniref:Ubiquitin-like domain-containing protein n=1 Tax=Oppiella nova TaxID=334625 RepID=A0A7R9LLM9_9ACAR|nr:unnamed protein product [Oppiella nova]CAG2164474.1 unnamed protein product [Oppiella nova]